MIRLTLHYHFNNYFCESAYLNGIIFIEARIFRFHVYSDKQQGKKEEKYQEI